MPIKIKLQTAAFLTEIRYKMNKVPKNICVVTGTRADYGLLQGVMTCIEASDNQNLQIIATGTHLVEEFGYTAHQIEADGFHINKKIEILLASDSPVSIVKTMALAEVGFAESFQELSPDIVILLGDRYEILAAASTALMFRIPVAHIHGGETSEGAVDESIRHAITKMAHLHFATTVEHRKRIIQMGENPNHVFHVGAPGLDHLDHLTLLDNQELSKILGPKLDKPYAVATYHPVTLPNRPNLEALNNLLAAVQEFPDMQFIFTYPNSDTFARDLIGRLKSFSDGNSQIVLTKSLGQLNYLSAVNNAAFVIGNSSSGIIEVPSLGKPSINIGDRQKGRIAAESIIHCAEDTSSIINAIKTAMSDKAQSHAKNIINPYKKANCSSQIFEHIKNIDLQNIIRKPFFDIKLT